jgi:hypothetical protein
MKTQRNIMLDAARGALAGAAATWVMGQVTSLLYEHENPRARDREDRARGGETAYEAAAERMAGLAGRPLGDDDRKRAGEALHWALGTGAGAAYGALRGRVPGVGAAAGLAFGALFFLIVDETVTPLLGLTPGPSAFPWQTHARGLAGHLVFGALADGALALTEPAPAPVGAGGV